MRGIMNRLLELISRHYKGPPLRHSDLWRAVGRPLGEPRSRWANYSCGHRAMPPEHFSILVDLAFDPSTEVEIIGASPDDGRVRHFRITNSNYEFESCMTENQ